MLRLDFKNVRLPSLDPEFASRVGLSGFFFIIIIIILVKVCLVPRALPLFDISLVAGKRTICDYRYNR